MCHCVVIYNFSKILTVPVAVDGHSNEEQHRHNNCRDDYGERNVIFSGVVDGAHHPLAVTEFHLERSREVQSRLWG